MSNCPIGVILEEETNDIVVVSLLEPFRGIGARRNSVETQQSGHAPRTGPDIKNGTSSID